MKRTVPTLIALSLIALDPYHFLAQTPVPGHSRAAHRKARVTPTVAKHKVAEPTVAARTEPAKPLPVTGDSPQPVTAALANPIQPAAAPPPEPKPTPAPIRAVAPPKASSLDPMLVPGSVQTPIPAAPAPRRPGAPNLTAKAPPPVVTSTTSPTSPIAPATASTKPPAANPAPAEKRPQGQVAAVFAPVVKATKPAAPTVPVADFAANRLNSAAAMAASLVPTSPRFLPVTIVNRHGGRVPQLALTDINIVEDGVRQRATSIERWPLWLVIVLDVGRQVGPAKQLADHRQLVFDLLYALGEDDHVALIQYSDAMELIQPWTLDARAAEDALMEKFESGLDGRLWESVTFATDELLDGRMGHRMIVVITDGVDDAGHDITYSRAMERVRETATTVHVVNLSQYLEEQIRKQAYGVEGVLGVIKSPSFIGRRRELRDYREKLVEAPEKMIQAAEQSGGKYFLANPDEDLALLPKRIWEQIEGQFMVEYEPERPESTRSLKAARPVAAFPTRGDIEVRTLPMLFAPIVPPRSAPTGEKLRRP